MPNRTIEKIVLLFSTYELASCVSLSANNLLAPNVVLGNVALSVLIKINFETSSFIDA